MKHTILLVDDEPQVLEALRTALHKAPYEILTATSGMEGMDILSRHRVDVVVSDERMPGMTGSVFLGMVLRKYPDSIRIILTGQASLDAAIRAINEGGVYRFLTKPCNPVDLSFTIHHALQMRDLARESARLLARTREQQALLDDLEKQYPGITRVGRDPSGAIVLDDEDIDTDYLLDEIRTELEVTRVR